MTARLDPLPCFPGETLTEHAHGLCPGRRRHDMLTGQCAWCKGLPEIPDLENWHHTDTPSPALQWIAAERRTECTGCAGDIDRGDPVAFSRDHNGWIGRCCGETA